MFNFMLNSVFVVDFGNQVQSWGVIFVLNCFLDQVHHVLGVSAVSPGYEGGAVHDGGGDGIDRPFYASKGRTLGLHSIAAGG